MSRLANFRNSQELLESSRLASRFFTRCRALPFAAVLVFLLSGVRAAVQAELDHFFALLGQRTRLLRVVTVQAFSKARHQIRADMFEPVIRVLLGVVGEGIGFARWCGLRPGAADASHVCLTLLGSKRRVRYFQDVVAFGLFLPGIEPFSRFALYEPVCDERQMLVEHLDALAPDDLLLDRGCPCAWLVALLTARNVNFCIRCDIEGNDFKAVRQFMRSGSRGAIVTLPLRMLMAPRLRTSLASAYSAHQ